VALIKFVAPQADELGFAKSIEVQEIGGTNCLVLQQDAALGSISTVVLRGSTEGFLDDVERALDDGINAYKVNQGGAVGTDTLSYRWVGPSFITGKGGTSLVLA
jgi:chaperonin GroEL (HSP60 family)